MAVNETNVLVSAKTVELAEHPDYLELVNRVCFYDAPNHNAVELDYDDDSLEKAETLVHMPVVAKYCADKDGKPTFKGHEVSKTKNGYEFGTKAIGTHTSVEIKEDEVVLVDGTKKKLPCLFATQRIWTRFKNATAAVKRLFEEDRLHNSWELKTAEYTFKNGIKHITDYAFIGNCFLGLAEPAYGESAKVISVASNEDGDLVIAEALAMDMVSESASNINYDGKEENEEMENFEIEIVEQSEIQVDESPEAVSECDVEVSEEVSVEETVDVEVSMEEAEGDTAESEFKVSGESIDQSSMNTMEDNRRMIVNALCEYCNDNHEYSYLDLSMVFPEEHVILAKNWRMKTLQFVKFDYRVDNEAVVLENAELVELVISPLSVNAEIEKKNNAIVESEKTIEQLNSQIEELGKAKAELDSIKEAKRKEVHNAEVNELKQYVLDSRCFTAEEINMDEFAARLEALDKAWIKNEIADRIVANRVKESKTEISEKEGSASADSFSIVLSGMDNSNVTSEDVMREFFGH